MISWSRAVFLQNFLVHLLLRLYAINRCRYFPTAETVVATAIYLWMENWRQQGTWHKMYAGWTEIKVVIWVYSIQCNVFIRQNQQYTPRCIIRRECIWSKPLQIWMKYFQTVFSGIRRSCFLKCCNHNEIAVRNKEAQCHEKVFKLQFMSSLCDRLIYRVPSNFHGAILMIIFWMLATLRSVDYAVERGLSIRPSNLNNMVPECSVRIATIATMPALLPIYCTSWVTVNFLPRICKDDTSPTICFMWIFHQNLLQYVVILTTANFP